MTRRTAQWWDMSQHVFQPRDLCGPYQIERFLASGGVGQVYLARHGYTDRNVALKVLHPVHEQDPRVRRRMQVEARVAAGLRHPNLVTVHDANVTPEGICYIAMEWLEGQSLRDLLMVQRRLTPADAFFIAEKVARGVAAAHELHVVHRDLKPENIWITTDRRIKVLDFGVAQWKDRGLVQTDPGIALGTPLYMAPEQLMAAICDEEHRPKVGPRADVYAVGSVTHESIAGKPVWLRESISQASTIPRSRDLLMWHAVRTPVALSTVVAGLPEQASALIASALERDPERRPRTMVEFAVELRRARLACLERYPDVELLLDSDSDRPRRRAYSLPAEFDVLPDDSRIGAPRALVAQQRQRPPAGALRSPPGVPDDDTGQQRAVSRMRIHLQGRLHSIFHTTSVRSKRYLPFVAALGIAAPIAAAIGWSTAASRGAPSERALAASPAPGHPAVATPSSDPAPPPQRAAAPPAAPASTQAEPVGAVAAVSAALPPPQSVLSSAPAKTPLTAPVRPARAKPRRDEDFFRTMDDP